MISTGLLTTAAVGLLAILSILAVFQIAECYPAVSGSAAPHQWSSMP